MEETPFRLLETMRWEDGRIALWPRHLDRLRRSATYFGFLLDEVAVLDALAAATDGLDDDGPWRVRLSLGRAGDPSVETAPLDDARPWTVRVYPEAVEARGPFFQHKTTQRAVYDAALAWARAQGADDALLVNPQGEVVETTRANVWIEQAGRMLTPPLSSVGGLAGVQRAHLLDTHPDAAEAVVRVDDLQAAEGLYLSNAVRGLFAAHLR